MSTATVRIDDAGGTTGYPGATKTMRSAADKAATTMTNLMSALSSTRGMAGSDAGGTAWANAYDEAAVKAYDIMYDLAFATAKFAQMLEATGANHAKADSHSNLDHKGDHPSLYLSDPEITCHAAPPSAHGDGTSPPSGWDKLVSFVGSIVWPNGDPDKLQSAANAWQTASGDLYQAMLLIDSVVNHVDTQQSDEVEHAIKALRSLQSDITTLSGTCTEIASQCSSYATQVENAHTNLKNEVESFIEWTIICEGAGLLLSVISLGASEVIAQSAQGVRVSAFLLRAAHIVEGLKNSATAAATAIKSIKSRSLNLAVKAAQRAKAARISIPSLRALKLVEESATYGKNSFTLLRDGRGRITSLRATITQEFGTVARGQADPKLLARAKNARIDKDEIGHGLGYRFFGKEADRTIFAQNSNFNRSAYKKLENEWADWTKEGMKVRPSIEFHYNKGSSRPSSLSVSYDVINPKNGKPVYSRTRVLKNQKGESFERVYRTPGRNEMRKRIERSEK